MMEKYNEKILVITDLGEGSDTLPKKPRSEGFRANYRCIGNDLTVPQGF